MIRKIERVVALIFREIIAWIFIEIQSCGDVGRCTVRLLENQQEFQECARPARESGRETDLENDDMT